jgi:hypothetical protein
MTNDTEAEALGKLVASHVPNNKTWARAYNASPSPVKSAWLSTHTQAPWDDHPHSFVEFDKTKKELKTAFKFHPLLPDVDPSGNVREPEVEGLGNKLPNIPQPTQNSINEAGQTAPIPNPKPC